MLDRKDIMRIVINAINQCEDCKDFKNLNQTFSDLNINDYAIGYIIEDIFYNMVMQSITGVFNKFTVEDLVNFIDSKINK